MISYGDKKINQCKKCISNENVERFVQAMDIGEIHDIPGYGAARTGTALTTMIMDLHRSVPSLKNKLRWFMTLKIIIFLNFLMMVHLNHGMVICVLGHYHCGI